MTECSPKSGEGGASTNRGKFEIEWRDGKREPQVKPNPAYPTGKDVDTSEGSRVTCSTPLPYPAKRIGAYVVTCLVCGLTVAVTTAGRPDDPRSLKVACKLPVLA